MGVSKDSTSLCQRIHVRRDRLRMTAEESDPVVEIVDRNEQDVWTVSSRGAFGNQRKQDNQTEESGHGELHFFLRFGATDTNLPA